MTALRVTTAALLLAVAEEPGDVELLAAILGRAGYRLHVATDVTEAREFLSENTPDLVLLDRDLPDGDGLDLIPEIRHAHRLGNVPILLLSASVHQHDVQLAVDAGADGILTKPVRVKPLVDAVRRLLGAGAVVPKLAD